MLGLQVDICFFLSVPCDCAHRQSPRQLEDRQQQRSQLTNT